MKFMYDPRKIFRSLGPGFITGASDDDPSGILTYTQTGAQFGYTQLWTIFLSIPFMTAIQEMCGRIGMVTGKGLAQVIRKHYTPSILYVAVFLLFAANAINIGADLGAMASSGELITGIPFPLLLLIFAVGTLLLQIFVDYHLYAKFLKYLTFALFAYILTAFIVHQDWTQVLRNTFVPTIQFDKDFVMNIVAIFGTTISPYLFFWQASEEVEEEVDRHMLRAMGVGKPKVKPADLQEMRIDTLIGMVFSNLVAFFIIITAASTLHGQGITTIKSAADAARSLEPIAGHFASFLFTIGVIGTGLLAIPVLSSSASYAVAETFKLSEGLSKKYYQAPGFYSVIALATLIGLAVNFVGVPPFRMLYYTAVINGLVAPPLMFLILMIANDKQIMGKHTNGPLANIFGWLITLFMGGASVALIEATWR